MNNANGFEILVNLARILVRRKRILFFGTLVPTLICIVVVMATESTYKSEALVNPPKTQEGSSLEAMASASGVGGALGSLLGGNETGLDDCVGILESSRFATLMIQHFDLETRYKFKQPGKTPPKYYFSDVIKRYKRNATYEVTKENALHISAQDKSPEQAKLMVDYMVYLLDSLYTDIQQEAIKHRLAYVDNRLAITLLETKALEDSLIHFQNRNNLLVPEAQIKMILENTTRTELRLETIKEDIALEAALRGTTSAKYRDLQSERRLLEQTLQSRLRSKSDSNSLILPTHTLPTLATEYYRLERAYGIRSGVYKYLVQQVEALKLDANKNVQVISVIDPAWVNDKRVSPKRRVMVEVVFILSLIFSILSVILLYRWDRYKSENPDAERSLREVRSGLLKF